MALEDPQNRDLRRQLSLTDSIAIVVGIMIGSGIFIVPSSIARTLDSPFVILSAWALAGVLSLLGALAYAELGAMMPATGGQYVFLRHSVGPLWAFLCGWSFFVAARSGGIASLAIAFSIYATHFVPLPGALPQFLAICIIALFTYVNYRGVKLGSFVQRLFTILKVAGLVLLIAMGFFSGDAPVNPSAAAGTFNWSAFGTALIACLWGYQGWVQVSFVAGEIRDPQRNLPLALVIGVATVIVLYLLANVSYMHALSLDEIRQAERPAAAVAQRVLGLPGAAFVSAIILFSITGAINGLMMTSPRLYFAQARDGLFFKKFGEIHPRHETPGFAVVAQGAWASVLAIGGSSFEALFSYTIFSFWIFYGLTVAGLMILRRKQRDVPRPYRMWGYPVTPLLFLVFTAAFTINALITRPGPALSALALMAVGVPVYYVWKRRRV